MFCFFTLEPNEEIPVLLPQVLEQKPEGTDFSTTHTSEAFLTHTVVHSVVLRTTSAISI